MDEVATHRTGGFLSMARQAAAERAWASIQRFYDNRKNKVAGKKRMRDAEVPSASERTKQGFQKDNRSVCRGDLSPITLIE
jgi:hypothetical protein